MKWSEYEVMDKEEELDEGWHNKKRNVRGKEVCNGEKNVSMCPCEFIILFLTKTKCVDTVLQVAFSL